jgi:hypothetical protein
MNFDFDTAKTADENLDDLVEFLYNLSRTMMHEDSAMDAENEAVTEIVEALADKLEQRARAKDEWYGLDDFRTIGSFEGLIDDEDLELIAEIAVDAWYKNM